MEYVAYSDESYSKGRFRSIASFSFLSDRLDDINATLSRLLEESSVSEFKWHKLNNAKYRFCALKIVDAVWNFLGGADARVDVIIWDTQDSRHAISNRDDTANYGRMFFHLHSQALRRRPKGSTWRLFPDERVEIDWETATRCIKAIGRQRQYVDSPLFGGFFTDRYYSISDLRQVESHKELCCQVADLFAGLAVFSRTHYHLFEKWKTRGMPSLFSEPDLSTSNREENRFKVLNEFNAGCKRRKLGVSLKMRRCLHTPDPINPINFWHYEPQHDEDKAPIRSV